MEILQLSEHGISDQALYGKMESGLNGPGQHITSCPRSACVHTFTTFFFYQLSKNLIYSSCLSMMVYYYINRVIHLRRSE